MSNSPKRTTFVEHLEAALIGVLFIGVGAMIASSVNAQNNKAPAPKATNEAACAPEKSPDAMCTLPIKNGPETRLCFGTLHTRCFELKDQHLFQSLKGATVQNTALDANQLKAAQLAIADYSKWLNAGLSSRANKNFSCQDPVSIETKSERKEYCLSALAKKEASAKTAALIAALEHPK